MIYFVGAGPGASDLITVRGARLISEADCIIHAGSLVNPDLLKNAQSACEIHDSSGMTLEEVITVMLASETAGKNTVRLHTGDPSLYGAIQEQIDLLIENNIAFEVVPGVSAFSGAAAVLGVEYTLPGVSQSLILSRTAGRTDVPEKEAIPLLAAHQTSMALFLSAGLLEKLSAELMEGGYLPDTPAAIVYKATWPDQKIIRTTVGELVQAAKQNDIGSTAMILVGGFLGSAYQRSRLYDPTFSHGFRRGNRD